MSNDRERPRPTGEDHRRHREREVENRPDTALTKRARRRAKGGPVKARMLTPEPGPRLRGGRRYSGRAARPPHYNLSLIHI